VVTKKIFAESAAASSTGLVQQPVQIVASHDLTLFVLDIFAPETDIDFSLDVLPFL